MAGKIKKITYSWIFIEPNKTFSFRFSLSNNRGTDRVQARSETCIYMNYNSLRFAWKLLWIQRVPVCIGRYAKQSMHSVSSFKLVILSFQRFATAQNFDIIINDHITFHCNFEVFFYYAATYRMLRTMSSSKLNILTRKYPLNTLPEKHIT